jgi:hypothetical protein
MITVTKSHNGQRIIYIIIATKMFPEQFTISIYMNTVKNKLPMVVIKNNVVIIPNNHFKIFSLKLLLIIQEKELTYSLAKSLRILNLCFRYYIYGIYIEVKF